MRMGANFVATLVVTVAVGITAAVLPARAEYPDHPIRYILHVSPGGATDVMARKLGNALQGVLGQPFVIENKPGGRGASQMIELTRAAPDGYTVGSVTNTHSATFHQVLTSREGLARAGLRTLPALGRGRQAHGRAGP